MQAGKRIRITIAIVGLLVAGILGYKSWPFGGGLKPWQAITVGDPDSTYRFLEERGGVLEIGVHDADSRKPLGVSKYVNIDPKGSFGLAMLPGLGCDGDDLSTLPLNHALSLGWFDEGSPVIGFRLPADTLNLPEKYAFGMTGVLLGDSSWQMVCIPAKARNVTLARVSGAASPAELAAAVAARPAGARWSIYHVRSILQAINGPNPPAGTHPSILMLEQYASAVTDVERQLILDLQKESRARAAACRSVLEECARIALPDGNPLPQFDYGAGAYNRETGRHEFAQKTMKPGEGLGDATLDQIVWLLASIDPKKWDAIALARCDRADGIQGLIRQYLITGRAPKGAGKRLGTAWAHSLNTQSPPPARGNFHEFDSPMNLALRLSLVPEAAEEANAFLDTAVEAGPESLVEAVSGWQHYSLMALLREGQTPEDIAATLNAVRWPRVRRYVWNVVLANETVIRPEFRNRLRLNGDTLEVIPEAK